MKTMGSYLLVVVAGVFHTQVLHAASQLRGERKVISTAAEFWEGIMPTRYSTLCRKHLS